MTYLIQIGKISVYTYPLLTEEQAGGPFENTRRKAFMKKKVLGVLLSAAMVVRASRQNAEHRRQRIPQREAVEGEDRSSSRDSRRDAKVGFVHISDPK